MKLITLCAALLAALFSLTAQAQGVTIGAAGAPDASAALEVRTTTQGLLLPRLTASQRDAIATPAAGLLVFQSNGTPGIYYYTGSNWVNLTTGRVPDPTGMANAPNTGFVSTLAGLAGSTGSANGTGAAARFYSPTGVAVDATDAVYVADQSNSTIRKITAAGVVSTLAGTAGSTGSADGTGAVARFRFPTGVAVDAAGAVYVAD
ncbi:MAG: hypothetical protein M3Y54_04350, partial [Bacteroidota bacterium]|nr:hypothetical protein [Bacteroidota bacterium]